MKIRKIFVIISLLCMFLLIATTNVYGNAAFPTWDSLPDEYKQYVYDIQNFKEENPGVSAVGRTFTIGNTTLEYSTELYCMSHKQTLESPAKYKIVKYLEIDGDSASIPGEVAPRESYSNVFLGQVLSRYSNRYGAYKSYSDTQKALWQYFKLWLLDDPDGTGTNQEYFGFDDSYGDGHFDEWEIENSTDQKIYDDGIAILQELENELSAARDNNRLDTYTTKVSLYFLECEVANWQRTLIAVPGPEDIKLNIYKVDADTRAPLANVGFQIRNSSSQYLYYDEATQKYGFGDITQAEIFRTDSTGYLTIIGIPEDTYEVIEVEPLPGYELNVGKSMQVIVRASGSSNTYTFENSKIPTDKEVTVEKWWVDQNNKDGTRPDSIEIELLRNGEVYRTATMRRNGSQDSSIWTYTFKNLPIADENGVEYIYSVVEKSKISGYKTVIREVEFNQKFRITNTYKTENIDIKVNKEWIDTNSSKRPDSVTVKLLADGVEEDSATLSENNNWEHTFTDLPVMRKNIYISIPDYVSYNIRSIDITLLADGKTVGRATLRDSSGWSCEFLHMDAYDSNGDEIEYTFNYRVDREDNSQPGNVFDEDFEMIEEEYEVEYDIQEVSVPGYTTAINVSDDGTEFTIRNKEIGIGNVILSGKVWLDASDGKGNNFNSEYNENSDDQTLQGIIVYWRDEDGNQIARTTTDSYGNYMMREEIEIYNHTYSIERAKYNLLNNSYVEFEYNGLKYTTVKEARTGDNTSKAIESVISRTNLDNSFDEITNKGVMDGGNVLSTTYMNRTTANLEYDHNSSEKTSTLRQQNADFPVIASTESVLSDLLDSYSETETETSSYCIREWTDSDGDTHHVYSQRIDEWYIKDVNLGLVLREQPDIALTSDIYKVRVIMKGQEYTYYYNTRGITAPSEDLFDYKVKFSGKYTQEYRRPVNPSDVAYVNYHDTEDLQVYVTYQITIKNQSTTLPIEVKEIVNYYDTQYDTDYAENQIANWSDVSTSTQDNYTEPTGHYEAIYNRELAGQVIDPGNSSAIISVEHKVNSDVVKSLINEEDILLKNVFEIYSYTTYYGIRTNCAEAKTAIQLGKSGMQYAGVDLDSAPGSARMELLTGQDGKPYLNTDTFEDDTDMAPTFVLCNDPNYKLLSGTVWEDSNTENREYERIGNGTHEADENVVEGAQVQLLRIKEDGTTEPAYLYYIGDQHQPVRELAIVYTDASGNYTFGALTEKGVVVDDYVLRFTYGNATDTYQDPEGNTHSNTLSTKINNPDGSATTNNVINARNYKSTVITSSELMNIMKTTEQEGEDGERYKWHLPNTDDSGTTITTINDNSTAIDDLQERISIPSLTYGNFEDGVNMSAYTAPFKVQLEYNTVTQESTLTQQTGNNGEINVSGEYFVGEGEVASVTPGNANSGIDYINDWGVFDFGIIERPREEFVVDKTIENIKLTLANGQVLIEGDPYGDNALNYVKALGDSTIGDTARNDARNAESKFLFVEIDTELLQGARLDILYKITVTNNSEYDYEYEYNYTNIEASSHIVKDDRANYYYFGEVTTPLIKSTVEWLVDYVDPELTCTVGPENTAIEDVNGVNGAIYDYQENEQEDSVVERVVWIQVTPEVDASGNRIKTAAQRLVDGNLMIDAERTPDGISDISAEQLISEEVKTRLENLEEGNYSIFLTNYFYDLTPDREDENNTKSLNIFASKLLGNQADDYTYENHAEILPSDGKIARTIDSVNDDGQQVDKWYRMGDYIPSLERNGTVTSWTNYEEGRHELDDDMITIRITPPTGLGSNAIIYISVGVVALIVLGVGIYIIKRKVLGR